MVNKITPDPGDEEIEFPESGYFMRESDLIVDCRKWKLQKNATIMEQDGNPRTFDYLLEDKTKEGRPRIIVWLGGHGYAYIAYISEYAQNVESSLNAVITNHLPTLHEQNFARSKGVTVIRTLKLVEESGVLTEVPGSSKNPVFSDSTDSSKVKRRSRKKVVEDILSVLNDEGGLSITKIVYRCNLNYQYAAKILNDLISKRILLLNDLGSRRIFRITDKGKDLLTKLSSIDF